MGRNILLFCKPKGFIPADVLLSYIMLFGFLFPEISFRFVSCLSPSLLFGIRYGTVFGLPFLSTIFPTVVFFGGLEE